MKKKEIITNRDYKKYHGILGYDVWYDFKYPFITRNWKKFRKTQWKTSLSKN